MFLPAANGAAPRAFEKVDSSLVGALLGKASNTSAPGGDRISAGIVKVFWQWDQERFTQLVRSCIRLGHHPKLWKTAKGVVIPKPGKPDYSKVRAYRVISLLDVVSKLVERTAAHLIADHLERKRGLHDGQFGCRKRRSCVDAVAVLMNRTQLAWKEKRVAGGLFMDVKSAFNNVSRAHLGGRMEALGVEPDLIRWTGSFMSDRQVKLILDGKAGDARPVDTGIPQGSPAAPILFVTYLSGIFDEVEAAVPGVHGLSFVDDISWWAEGKDDKEVAAKLSEAATAAAGWAARNGVAFDQGKTEAAIFHKKRAASKATVEVGGSKVPFNKEATRWLGVWLDSQLTLKEHHAVRMKRGRKAMTRLHRLTGQMGLSPTNCRKVMTACVQSAAMFGAELWWKGDLAEGTIGRAKGTPAAGQPGGTYDNGLLPDNQPGSLIIGVGPRSSNSAAGEQTAAVRTTATEPAGRGSGKGSGRSPLRNRTAAQEERTVLLEEPETLDAELLQEEEAEAKAAAEGTRPGLTMFTDGHDWTTGRPGIRWYGKRAKPGRGSKFTWATTKKPMTLSALRSPAPWSWHRKGTRPRNESPSSRMHRQPSGGWHRTSPALGNSMPSRHRSISPSYARLGRGSSSRCGGARRTKESPAMRRPMSGQR